MGFDPHGPVQGSYFESRPRMSYTSAHGIAHGPQVNTDPEAVGNPYLKTQTMLSFSKTEHIVNQALESALAGARLQVDPRDLFPPRQGYDRDVIGVTDVLRKDRFMGRDARFDYSGTTNTYRGTSRNGLGMV